MTTEEQGKKLGKIIKMAWEDELFKQRLLNNANDVFREEGFDVTGDINIKVVENTELVQYIVIPANRSNSALTDEALSKISAGETRSIPCGNRDACDPRPGLAQ